MQLPGDSIRDPTNNPQSLSSGHVFTHHSPKGAQTRRIARWLHYLYVLSFA